MGDKEIDKSDQIFSRVHLVSGRTFIMVHNKEKQEGYRSRVYRRIIYTQLIYLRLFIFT